MHPDHRIAAPAPPHRALAPDAPRASRAKPASQFFRRVAEADADVGGLLVELERLHLEAKEAKRRGDLPSFHHAVRGYLSACDRAVARLRRIGASVRRLA
jgi:hypothetical protein